MKEANPGLIQSPTQEPFDKSYSVETDLELICSSVIILWTSYHA